MSASMMHPAAREKSLPGGVGVGLKPCHIQDILKDPDGVDWFEVHAENYMGAGGPPHYWLEMIRQDFPLSVHGVGLSIGGAEEIDTEHLARLGAVVDRYDPALVSEHLAWSTHQGRYYNDLLALPYTQETLACVVRHIYQVQTFLGREILIENPSTYVTFDHSEMDEPSFIGEALRQTGCGLLLDVNNVFVTCTNHRLDIQAYLEALPLDKVGQIHLAGHAHDPVPHTETLLIDAHDRSVSDSVWALYQTVLRRIGCLPTLIEWDNNIPPWATLKAEAEKASGLMTQEAAPSLLTASFSHPLTHPLCGGKESHVE